MDQSTSDGSGREDDTVGDDAYNPDEILKVAIEYLQKAQSGDGDVLRNLKYAKMGLNIFITDPHPKVIDAIWKYRKEMHDCIERFFPELEQYLAAAEECLQKIECERLAGADGSEESSADTEQQHWFQACAYRDLAAQLINKLGRYSYRDNSWAGSARGRLARINNQINALQKSSD